MIESEALPRGSSISRHAETPARQARFEGLDALRAVAMLLGIMLHAAVPYTQTRMPDLLWAVHDAVPSDLCDLVFWSIHVFRLPVYFVLSGYFAELLFQKRGRQQFLQHRVQRLLIPYVGSIATIGVATFGLFAWGWYLTGRCTLEQIFNPFVFFTPDIQQNFFGPAHLWFLGDLILLTSAYWMLRGETGPSTARGTRPGRGAASVEQPAAGSRFSGSCPSPLAPFLFALPTAMILWGNVSPVVAFNNSFIPDPPRLLYFGIYFACGVMFHRHPKWFLEAIRFPRIHLSLAIPCTLLSVLALRWQIDSPGTLHQLLVGVSVCTAAWFSIFGWFGVFVHHWRISSSTIQYLADSSYWVYLCHLPLTVLAQILLRDAALPTNLKFLLVSAFTLIAGLSSYSLWVRYSFIGRLLNGPRQILPQKPVSVVPAPHLPLPTFPQTVSAGMVQSAGSAVTGRDAWQSRK